MAMLEQYVPPHLLREYSLFIRTGFYLFSLVLVLKHMPGRTLRRLSCLGLFASVFVLERVFNVGAVWKLMIRFASSRALDIDMVLVYISALSVCVCLKVDLRSLVWLSRKGRLAKRVILVHVAVLLSICLLIVLVPFLLRTFEPPGFRARPSVLGHALLAAGPNASCLCWAWCLSLLGERKEKSRTTLLAMLAAVVSYQSLNAVWFYYAKNTVFRTLISNPNFAWRADWIHAVPWLISSLLPSLVLLCWSWDIFPSQSARRCLGSPLSKTLPSEP